MLNMRFFTPYNLAVIFAFVVLWHMAASPIYRVLGGEPNGE